jgi:hypothetical protein
VTNCKDVNCKTEMSLQPETFLKDATMAILLHFSITEVCKSNLYPSRSDLLEPIAFAAVTNGAYYNA